MDTPLRQPPIRSPCVLHLLPISLRRENPSPSSLPHHGHTAPPTVRSATHAFFIFCPFPRAAIIHRPSPPRRRTQPTPSFTPVRKSHTPAPTGRSPTRPPVTPIHKSHNTIERSSSQSMVSRKRPFRPRHTSVHCISTSVQTAAPSTIRSTPADRVSQPNCAVRSPSSGSGYVA